MKMPRNWFSLTRSRMWKISPCSTEVNAPGRTTLATTSVLTFVTASFISRCSSGAR